jgi:hypothetical protein
MPPLNFPPHPCRVLASSHYSPTINSQCAEVEFDLESVHPKVSPVGYFRPNRYFVRFWMSVHCGRERTAKVLSHGRSWIRENAGDTP